MDVFYKLLANGRVIFSIARENGRKAHPQHYECNEADLLRIRDRIDEALAAIAVQRKFVKIAEREDLPEDLPVAIHDFPFTDY